MALSGWKSQKSSTLMLFHAMILFHNEQLLYLAVHYFAQPQCSSLSDASYRFLTCQTEGVTALEQDHKRVLVGAIRF